jgi:Domain of unknown function (DUF4150)/GHH signature containing HNH/Endo VII superfamily nuclease toxin  2
MADDVFANTREITCQSGSSKSIAAFPDVCMTPPENPATPPGVPVPYPNFGMASDTTNGSKNVKINKKPVMLKNQSYFKKSMGDEAGCAAKKGVVSSVNRGKVYFVSWSPDVKVESKNVVRHLDMTTHNHASPTANEGIPWPHVGRMDLMNSIEGCNAEKEKIKDKCGDPVDQNKAKCPDDLAVVTAKAEHKRACDLRPRENNPKRDAEQAAATAKLKMAQENYELEILRNECTRALRCALVSYEKGRESACCPHMTPDHLVPASHFGKGRGRRTKYRATQAPCMCATGGAHTATHALLGRGRTRFMRANDIPPNQDRDVWTVEKACECGADSAEKVTGCTMACVKAQLEKAHKDMKVDLQRKISTNKEKVTEEDEDLDALQELMDEYPIGLK